MKMDYTFKELIRRATIEETFEEFVNKTFFYRDGLMSCPYSPYGKNKVKCKLYQSNSFDCNKVCGFDNCGKFRTLEGY